MSSLISIKSFLGKYYTDLKYSCDCKKYENTELDTFFDQRFYIQNNKIQMIVDSVLLGLAVIISGNEIRISEEFYNHSNIIITNTVEDPINDIKSLYTPEVFSTIAYLICQNHTLFQIIGEIDEPIYVTYKSDFETFYNSVVIFEISNDLEVEIVEEFESAGALNSVINYILYPDSKLRLSTFYQNNVSGISFIFRNIILQDSARINHILLGRGSSNIIDENKVFTYNNSYSEFYGIINSNNRNFHSILYVYPVSKNYFVSVDYKDIIYGKSKISFLPVILGQLIVDNSFISISNITLERIPVADIDFEIKNYIGDIMEKSRSEKIIGIERFYNNKTKFLHFL